MSRPVVLLTPFANHQINLRIGARDLHKVIIVAGSRAIMVLHQARIAHTVVARGGADTAAGFLHDRRKDETVVDKGCSGGGFDGIPDLAYFRAGVACLAPPGAGGEHSIFVIVKPVNILIRWCCLLDVEVICGHTYRRMKP
jgi:hypothetical protein